MPITRFLWTEHVLLRADQRRFTTVEIETAVQTQHPHRTRNAGEGHWRVETDRLVVIYDHPAGDERTVRILTAWRPRRRR